MAEWLDKDESVEGSRPDFYSGLKIHKYGENGWRKIHQKDIQSRGGWEEREGERVDLKGDWMKEIKDFIM